MNRERSSLMNLDKENIMKMEEIEYKRENEQRENRRKEGEWKKKENEMEVQM